jgi:hypothetical protein
MSSIRESIEISCSKQLEYVLPQTMPNNVQLWENYIQHMTWVQGPVLDPDHIAGAVATIQDKEGFTPIMLACKRNDAPLLELLLASKPKPKLTHQTCEGTVATHYAASHTDQVCLAALLKAGASANSLDHAGNSPLMVACLAGSLPAVQQLISSGVDINTG